MGNYRIKIREFGDGSIKYLPQFRQFLFWKTLSTKTILKNGEEIPNITAMASGTEHWLDDKEKAIGRIEEHKSLELKSKIIKESILFV